MKIENDKRDLSEICMNCGKPYYKHSTKGYCDDKKYGTWFEPKKK